MLWLWCVFAAIETLTKTLDMIKIRCMPVWNFQLINNKKRDIEGGWDNHIRGMGRGG